jgi:hypothetical protein
MSAAPTLSSLSRSSLRERLFSASSSDNPKAKDQPAGISQPEKTLADSSMPKQVSSDASLTSSASSVREAVASATHQLEDRIHKIIAPVQNVSVSDVLVVTGIVVLLGSILAAPLVSRAVRNTSGATASEDVYTNDVVDDFIQLLRTNGENEYEILANVVNASAQGRSSSSAPSSSSNPLAVVLKDVMQSETVHQAALDFCLRLLASEPLKQALNRLVAEQFAALVEDPETLQQIIFLLQKAIADPAVRLSLQKLVIDLVNEPEVKETLLQLVQKLGTDTQVLNATTTLLTDSAHYALDDPELLDHSMAFATDVVGDDIVQRTAGEALRNTVGHAVRPVSIVLLTAMGVGCVITAILALGYARAASVDEVQILDRAARSLQQNVYHALVRAITWPQRKWKQLNNSSREKAVPSFVEVTSSRVLQAIQCAGMWCWDSLNQLIGCVMEPGNTDVSGLSDSWVNLSISWNLWYAEASKNWGRWAEGILLELSRHGKQGCLWTWSYIQRWSGILLKVMNTLWEEFNREFGDDDSPGDSAGVGGANGLGRESTGHDESNGSSCLVVR